MASDAPAFSFASMRGIHHATQQLADHYQTQTENDVNDDEDVASAPNALLRHKDQQPKNPEIDDSQPRAKIVEIA